MEMLEDRIENESFIALSDKVKRLMELAYAQKGRIQEQEQTIKDLEQEVESLRNERMGLREELNKRTTAQTLLGQGTDSEQAKMYIDELLASLKSSLAKVQSLEVVDYKEER